MFSAGVDVGAENIKVVILEGARLLDHHVISSGWDAGPAADKAFQEVVFRTGIERSLIKQIGATGMGRGSVLFATAAASESTCGARGAIWLRPSSQTVIDVGAEQSQAFGCDAAGRVLDYVRNDSCAAGAGVFIEEMAAVLEKHISEISSLASRATQDITLNSTCTIFAESEVISLINEGFSKEDIARAVCDATASRVASLLKGLAASENLLFIGGVAKNRCVVGLLSKKLGRSITVPAEPAILTAIGAALVAQSSENKVK